MEVPIPRYFVRERMKALKEREKMLAHILDKRGNIEQEPVRIKHFITPNNITAFIFFQVIYCPFSKSVCVIP